MYVFISSKKKKVYGIMWTHWKRIAVETIQLGTLKKKKFWFVQAWTQAQVL